MILQKRDDFPIAPTLIIFLVVLGAGGLVICGFAVMRFWGGDAAQDGNWVNRSVEQDQYMREVRERAWDQLPGSGQLPMHNPRAAAAYSVQSANASHVSYG